MTPTREQLEEINMILNMHENVKIKRALLRELGLSEKSIDELCPMNEVTY